MKTLKFRDYLVPLILSGEKTDTWRINDEKDLSKEDIIEFINKDTMNFFATARILDVRETTLSGLTDEDWEGHEKFSSDEEMYKTYSEYYKFPVNESTILKIVSFELIEKE